MSELTGVWPWNALYGLLAGFMGLWVLWWNFRGLLIGLSLLQLGLGQVMVQRYDMEMRWALVLGAVTVIACAILALTAEQRSPHSWTPPMPRLFRGLLLALLVGGVLAVDLGEHLPLVDGATARLLIGVALTGFLILAWTDDPLYVAVGLLLWMMPSQLFLALALPVPILAVLLNGVILAAVLACSYLALAGDVELAMRSRPLTDIAFPEPARGEPAAARSSVPGLLGGRSAPIRRWRQFGAQLRRALR